MVKNVKTWLKWYWYKKWLELVKKDLSWSKNWLKLVKTFPDLVKNALSGPIWPGLVKKNMF